MTLWRSQLALHLVYMVYTKLLHTNRGLGGLLETPNTPLKNVQIQGIAKKKFNTHTPLSKPFELVHKLPFIVRGNVPLPKGTLKIIPILYWRIPMNSSFPNKGSPLIEGIPLEAKGSQWNFSLFTNMMASKELFNLHFPI